MIYLNEHQGEPGLLKFGRKLRALAVAFLDLREGRAVVNRQVVGLPFLELSRFTFVVLAYQGPVPITMHNRLSWVLRILGVGERQLTE